MKINTTKTKNQGSVLLVTLCTAWIIGIALVSYLTLVANQHRTTHHSQTWSTCIPVLEAGIEEALTQLNYNNGQGTNNAVTYGWTNVSSGVYSKSRVLTDGSYYEVAINANGATPVITSTGYAPAPQNTGMPMGGENAFGMILGTVSQSTAAMVSRTVVVGTRLDNLGGGKGGLNSKGTIVFSGTATLDSFDSSDPNKSTNGTYDAAKRQANGQAMSNGTAAGVIQLDKAHIYGSVTTGPGGTVGANSSASVGDLNWNATSTGFQPGHKTADANLQFDDVVAPFVYGNGSTPTQGAGGNGTNYDFVLDAAQNTKWNAASINLPAGKSMIVTGGEVSLYVNTSFNVGSGGLLYIAPGASVKLYVGTTFANSGGAFVNATGLAKNLSIYGLGTTKETWVYSGSSAFVGTVYSPYDQFFFSGTAGAFGAFTANNITISGGAAVHYDESLSGGSTSQYIASSWNEI